MGNRQLRGCCSGHRRWGLQQHDPLQAEQRLGYFFACPGTRRVRRRESACAHGLYPRSLVDDRAAGNIGEHDTGHQQPIRRVIVLPLGGSYKG